MDFKQQCFKENNSQLLKQVNVKNNNKPDVTESDVCPQ